ncbi:MAG: gas vesicle protein [Nitrospirae bacterium]|nr:gas vesicle protein [Nitrospirota bacterium]
MPLRSGKMTSMTDPRPQDAASPSLCEILDRILNQGVALRGDLVISVADVDLIYIDLRLLIAAVETAASAGAFVPGRRESGDALPLRMPASVEGR